MNKQLCDSKLDKQLRVYMEKGPDQAFSLDTDRVLHPQKTRFVFHKAYVSAAILLLFILVIPQVSAAIGMLFTFIPGVGIVWKQEAAIFSMEPVVSITEMDQNPTVEALLENAVYANGYINISLVVSGQLVQTEEIGLYVNGEPLAYSASGSWSAGSTLTQYQSLWLEMPQLPDNPLFEIRLAGFSEALSFTLVPCESFDSLSQIGATDTQNGISITTHISAAANENSNADSFVVWCYPFLESTTATNDKLTGIGSPFPSIWLNEAYIESESGFKSIYTGTGRRITEQLIFHKPPVGDAVTLHIPYLTFVRDEKKRMTIPIPKNYETITCDTIATFTLGTVRITKIEKRPAADQKLQDTLRITFAFDSAEEQKIFNSFCIENNDLSGYMSCFDEDAGLLDFIEIDVDRDLTKLTFTIYDLCYYWLGSYTIPLLDGGL